MMSKFDPDRWDTDNCYQLEYIVFIRLSVIGLKELSSKIQQISTNIKNLFYRLSPLKRIQ